MPVTVLFIGSVVPLEPSRRCLDSEEGRRLLLECLLRSNLGVVICYPFMLILIFALTAESAPDLTDY